VDYDVARGILTALEKATVYGVGQNVLDFYETCLKPPEGSLALRYTCEDLHVNM